MNAIEIITKEIMEDTDCKEKQSQYLEDIYCNSNNKSEIDECFICLCGYSLSSILGI
ncbi:TPA: hypothetical protein KKX27_002587 [Legionella pneumophila]|nr:hypothetical protein [Legionella pneumophila]HEN8241094.1 hypothetical protein [Legionella pneumophila]